MNSLTQHRHTVCCFLTTHVDAMLNMHAAHVTRAIQLRCKRCLSPLSSPNLSNFLRILVPSAASYIMIWQGYENFRWCRGFRMTTWPVNWEVMMENTMDPSHACFLHDGLAGKWEEAAPMTMRLKHNTVDVTKVGTVTASKGLTGSLKALKDT